MKKPSELFIIVEPSKRAGYFAAHLADRGDVIVRSSRQPFLDATRRLIDLGYDPSMVLIMRHAGSDIDSLRVPIGVAAKLSVKEGRGKPRFVKWEPFPRRVKAQMRQIAAGAIELAPNQIIEPSPRAGAEVPIERAASNSSLVE